MSTHTSYLAARLGNPPRLSLLICQFLLLLLLSPLTYAEESYVFATKWGSPLPTEDGQFNYPNGIAVDSSGDVYVADWVNDQNMIVNTRIQKFTATGAFLTQWGSFGLQNGQFTAATGIAIDSSGNVYVTDPSGRSIQKFTNIGGFIDKWGFSIANWGFGGKDLDLDGAITSPEGIAVDSSGNVYITDTNNHRIRKFSANGQILTEWGSNGSGDGQFISPEGVAIDSSGNVYVADSINHRIQKFTANGQVLTQWGGSGGGSFGSGDGQFHIPQGIAIDSSGNVYVADRWNHRIQKFTANGQFITKWGSKGSGDGQFDNPNGIAIDSSGNVYVADTGNRRIQKFAPCYTISPAVRTHTANAESGSVTITGSNPACTWNASSNQTWSSITSGNSGTGNGSVSYSVQANPDTSQRTGTLTIAGQTFTIHQAGQSVYSLNVTNHGMGTVTSSPSGIACGTDCTENYTASTRVTLTAKSDNGWIFSSWGGDCSGNSLTTNATMDRAKTCTANFTLAPVSNYTLTLATSGTGSGTVSGGGTYEKGTLVTPTATTHADSVFSGWSPASCGSPFALTADTVCTANFTLIPPVSYTLTLATSGTGSGTVSGGGTYEKGTLVTPTAATHADSVFSGWSPASCGSPFALTADTVCTANFSPARKVHIQISGSGTISGMGLTCESSSFVPHECVLAVAEGSALTFAVAAGSGYAVSFAGSARPNVLPSCNYTHETVNGSGTSAIAALSADCALQVGFYRQSPEVTNTISFLAGCKTPVEEFLGYYGTFPEDGMIDDVCRRSSTYADFLLNPDGFYVEAKIKSPAPFTPAVGGKTLRLTFDPFAKVWYGSPGEVDGVSDEFLPLALRKPVVARFSVTPQSAAAPVNAQADGSASSASNGIVEYDWLWADLSAGMSPSTQKGKLVDFALSAGVHAIRLKVTDAVGNQGVALHTVTSLAAKTYILTVQKVGQGSVRGSGVYAGGSTVNLYAWSANDWQFKGWQPAPCAESFVMPMQDLTCTATFEAIPRLNISPAAYDFGSAAVLPVAPAALPASRRGALNAEYAPNRVIVKFRDSSRRSARGALRRQQNVELIEELPLINSEVWQVADVAAAVEAQSRSANQDIEYIEPDYLVGLYAVPNDPSFGLLWGLHNSGQGNVTPDGDIDAPEAWEIAKDSNVVCAVIDSGVDYTHPDLEANLWKNPGEIAGNAVDDDNNGYVDDVYGYDFVNNDADPMDDSGHGTHVAGTMAGVGNNGIGVVGVNWSGKVMALKFLGANGKGNVSDAVRAIEYATSMGVKCTNNSWGGGDYSQALYDVIKAAGEKGALFVAAAGNASKSNDITPSYPASYDLDNIISVCASDGQDMLAAFSNFGKTTVDVCAPGVGIPSSVPGNSYALNSGTSMASPHVAGAVALLWTKYPELSAAQVKAKLLGAADVKATLAGSSLTGGRLNLHQALIDGAQSQQHFIVTNTGQGAVELASVVLGGQHPTEFEIQQNTCSGSLNAGDSCKVTVDFAPVSAGGKQATLIVSTSSGQSASATLSGTAELVGGTSSGEAAFNFAALSVFDPLTGQAFLSSVFIAGNAAQEYGITLCWAGDAFTICGFSEQQAMSGAFEQLGNVIFDPVTGIADIPVIWVRGVSGDAEVGVLPGAYSVQLQLVNDQLQVLGLVPIW